jgi:hypothetical protein
MKKVRYAVGAIGAVIPAIGLMAPQTAAAAAHHPANRKAATPDASCTANKKVVATNADNSTLRFTWDPTGSPSYVCIGPITGFTEVELITAESYWRVRIYDRNRSGSKKQAYSHHFLGPEPPLIEKSRSFTDNIHEVFGFAPVEVCMNWVLGNKTTGPLTCHSVN